MSSTVLCFVRQCISRFVVLYFDLLLSQYFNCISEYKSKFQAVDKHSEKSRIPVCFAIELFVTVLCFSVDHKSSKELRQYLANVAEQCENNALDLPSVIILDNLHHAASLGEVFNGFLNAKYSKCPYIIGTMNQATCSTTNLQLHHNFRYSMSY